MSIAETIEDSSDATTKASAKVTNIYVNMNFKAIAEGINQEPSGSYRYDGKGRIVAALTKNLEDQNVYYSWDSAGDDHIPQPIPMNNGEQVKFIVQETPGGDCNASPSWKGILQSIFALQLVSGKKSTYLAVNSTESTEEDAVTFNVKFKIKEGKTKTKYLVSWDPKVKIIKA